MIDDNNNDKPARAWPYLDQLREAVKGIDQCLGDGFAQSHPELVGTLLLAQAVDHVAFAIEDGADGMADALTGDKSDDDDEAEQQAAD